MTVGPTAFSSRLTTPWHVAHTSAAVCDPIRRTERARLHRSLEPVGEQFER